MAIKRRMLMPFNTDRVVYLMYFTAVSCHTYMKMSMPCNVRWNHQWRVVCITIWWAVMEIVYKICACSVVPSAKYGWKLAAGDKKCMNKRFGPFVLLWPWPWSNDLHIRTWPILFGDTSDVQIWTSYIKVF